MQRDKLNHRMLCFAFNQQQQQLSSLSNNTADTLLSKHQLFSSF